MKLKKILNRLMEDVDPNAMASANALILIDRLKNNAQFMKALSQIQMPTDKYKAIIRFADLLGIPDERFDDFIANMKVQTQKNVITNTNTVKESKKERHTIKKGAKIAGYTSNGEHYVEVDGSTWTLYAPTGTKLTQGKINNQLDLDYILKNKEQGQE